MCVLTTCMSEYTFKPGAYGGQKTMSDPLELQPQMVLRHHLGAED